ncbi:hypothetical protein CJU94_23145 [Paraburkholderia aromaticivorans]|uniref:Uncharacterized protein n=1 Tax=Paraburkholderia aromaticivorans TaxID=2026199 RepID=A0A248VQF4_9BURK|nr:hypothetical protein CJU94_23145 [Paraburkholderia aromaticivorans]
MTEWWGKWTAAFGPPFLLALALQAGYAKILILVGALLFGVYLWESSCDISQWFCLNEALLVSD